MSKLSQFFGRTGASDVNVNEKIDEKFAPLANAKESGLVHNAETIDDSSFSTIGSRIGEENEGLRTQLIEAGRKIAELDILKETFSNIVEPVGKMLRELEQAKSQNLSLRTLLGETRAAYEKVRAEYYAGERKSNGLESDNERLREDLEVAQQTARGLESNNAELSNNLASKTAHIVNIERQLAAESAQRQAFAEDNRVLGEKNGASDRKIVQLEAETETAREKCILAEEENRSLQKSLDQTVGEVSRLSRRLTESENALAAARARLGQLEANAAELQTERNNLAGQLDEAVERHRTEINTLSTRLDSLQSRATTAEKLLSESRQNLVARSEEVRDFDRKAVEATIVRNSSDKKLRQLEVVYEAQENQIAELTQARSALMERANAVSKTLKAREGALSRAEEKINTLTDRIARLEADIQSNRAAEEKRAEDLNSALNRERMERAVAEGALEASRKDFARLQREMMALNASQRRSTAPLALNPAIAHDPAEGAADTPKGKMSRRQTPASPVEPIIKN